MYNINDYKNEIIRLLKKYNLIIHTNKENEFKWLNDNYYRIEISNLCGDSIYIDLEEEITISFGYWHTHYLYGDISDLDSYLEVVSNIIDNNDCILTILIDNNLFGGGYIPNKNKYDEEDVVDFLKSFLKDKSYEEFINSLNNRKVTVKVNYWRKDNNYELNIDDVLF